MSAYSDDALYRRAFEHARAYLEALPGRTTATTASREDLRAALAVPLADQPRDPVLVLDELVTAALPGIVSTAGPRYFGFVTGGSFPVAVAADWLTSVWDQPASLYVLSPATSLIEETASGWLLDLLGLPSSCSTGFVTGAHAANFTALAAARHEVLRRVGWDVEARGLQGAPTVNVVHGGEAHISISGALRMLGLGAQTPVVVPADAQGRMPADAVSHALTRCSGPTIVCAQAGNVNTGACDPLKEIAAACAAHGAWLHVDGAFGLWAAASPSRRHLVDGVGLADSWATDGHKWLNVPYDSGLVFVRHEAAHRAAMSLAASYLVRGEHEERHGMDWVPESSRRARALPIYVTLRSLGRRGTADLVDRCCSLAVRMAGLLAAEPRISILNEVVLNQVLVRVGPASPDAAADEATRRLVSTVQAGGVCWAGGTRWHDMDAMRISVSNWGTTEDDIERSVESILRTI